MAVAIVEMLSGPPVMIDTWHTLPYLRFFPQFELLNILLIAHLIVLGIWIPIYLFWLTVRTLVCPNGGCTFANGKNVGPLLSN